MTRRTLSLGSGLNPIKLADSIRQIRADKPPNGALVCHAEENEHAWVHLRVAPEAHEAPAHWHLNVGLPTDASEADIRNGDAGNLAVFVGWNPGIEATLHLPMTVEPLTLAQYIGYLMTTIQLTTEQQSIRINIEYP